MIGRTKVEKSTHFHEILDMIKQGFSSYKISDYLHVEYDESISHTAINNYVKKIKKKTAEKYYEETKKGSKVNNAVQKEQNKHDSEEEVVQKGVNDLKAMDNIIQEADKIRINFDDVVPENHTDYIVTTPLDIVNSKMKYKGLAIQAVNAKARILKDDSEIDKEFIIHIVSDLDEKDRVEADKETA